MESGCKMRTSVGFHGNRLKTKTKAAYTQTKNKAMHIRTTLCGQCAWPDLYAQLLSNAQAAAWRTRQPRRKYNYTYFVEIVVVIK